LDVDVDGRVRAVVEVTFQFARDDGVGADVVFGFADDAPCDFWRIGTDAAEDFALKELDDFGTAQFPPVFRGGDAAAVIEAKDFGVVGNGFAVASS
jgi:hypothetical protein